jgi:putative transcriptional regulator
LVLNRPSTTDLEDVLPDWHGFASAPARVFVGGPVSPDAVIALARRPSARAHTGAAHAGWVPLVDDLGTVDVGLDPAEVAAGVRELRIFLGYAGWAPDQLEAELDQGAWFVVNTLPSDPFTPDPSALWTAVLRRQRSRLAMFAMCPTDPSVN